MMYDGNQYDLIQGQGHELLKVENLAIFKGPPPFVMGVGK